MSPTRTHGDAERWDYPFLLRQHAQRTVVDALLQRPSATALELRDFTGLPEELVTSATHDLKSDGWIKTSAQPTEGSARATQVYTLAHDAAYSVGVDLGGTKIAAAIADFSGQVIAERTDPTDPRGGQHTVDQIIALSQRLALSAGIDASKIQSAVVGIPGAVDPVTGRVTLAPNIKGLAELDVLGQLRSHFGPLVSLENDVNLAMLGEVAQGGAKGRRNSAFLALGTGAGLGLLVEGRLVRGASGAAGEIGYLPIGRDTDSPSALHTGAFELEVGSSALLARYRAQSRKSIATVRDIFSLFHEGDSTAAEVLDGTSRSIALAVAALQAILDLEIVVLGGSIGARPELVARVRREVASVFARPIHIIASELGNRAGLVGAAHSAVKQLHDHRCGEEVFWERRQLSTGLAFEQPTERPVHAP
jgi:predicted NBD/HSP70 family sugar kinase